LRKKRRTRKPADHKKKIEGDRRTCKCGCGTPVNWDSSRGRWRDYVDHHRSPELNEKIRKAAMEKSIRTSREFFERIRGFLPCTQSTLHEELGLRKKVCSQAPFYSFILNFN